MYIIYRARHKTFMSASIHRSLHAEVHLSKKLKSRDRPQKAKNPFHLSRTQIMFVFEGRECRAGVERA